MTKLSFRVLRCWNSSHNEELPLGKSIQTQMILDGLVVVLCCFDTPLSGSKPQLWKIWSSLPLPLPLLSPYIARIFSLTRNSPVFGFGFKTLRSLKLTAFSDKRSWPALGFSAVSSPWTGTLSPSTWHAARAGVGTGLVAWGLRSASPGFWSEVVGGSACGVAITEGDGT